MWIHPCTWKNSLYTKTRPWSLNQYKHRCLVTEYSTCIKNSYCKTNTVEQPSFPCNKNSHMSNMYSSDLAGHPVCSGPHCWSYFPGTLSCNQVSEDQATEEFIYRCPIFRWVEVTRFNERAPGEPQPCLPCDMSYCFSQQTSSQCPKPTIWKLSLFYSI